MLAQSVNHVTLDTSSSPTKSEGDSAVLEGLVQAKDGGEAIPPVVARFFFGRQHLTFDKGGKCGGAKQGIVQKISLMVGMGSDHHHSWLGLTVQQNLTLLNVRE